jgi:hypothetical protein
LTALVLSLMSVRVSVLLVLGATAVGAKDFVTRTFEKSVALAGARLLTFCVSVRVPAAIVLM